MARIRDQKSYDTTRIKLLDVGEQLFRQGSFAEVSINDVLKEAKVAKGSFYHYFSSKEEFGLAVARRYSDMQVESSRKILNESSLPAIERLVTFFKTASLDMENRGFAEGCLMCNLTTELADENPLFQGELRNNWRALSMEVSRCLEEVNLSSLRLSHLTTEEAADWLLNAWSGSLVRMKVTGDGSPLHLFIKSTFGRKEQ